MATPGMPEPWASEEVVLVNKHGLHARPSTMIVGVANSFRSRVTIRVDGRSADGKSIMEVMMLASPRGTRLVLEAEGDDADAVIAALKDLIGRGFDEELM